MGFDSHLAEGQAHACRVSAAVRFLVKLHVFFKNGLAVFGRDTGTVVLDEKRDFWGFRVLKTYLNGLPGGRILNGIGKEILQDPEQNSPISP